MGAGRFRVPDDQSGIGGLTIETLNGTNLKLGGNSTYSWIQSHAALPLYINELGNNTIINARYGNVGIGTNNPTARLHVNNGDNSYGTILANASEEAFSLYTKTFSTQPVYTESFRIGMKYNTTEDNARSHPHPHHHQHDLHTDLVHSSNSLRSPTSICQRVMFPLPDQGRALQPCRL